MGKNKSENDIAARSVAHGFLAGKTRAVWGSYAHTQSILTYLCGSAAETGPLSTSALKQLRKKKYSAVRVEVKRVAAVFARASGSSDVDQSTNAIGETCLCVPAMIEIILAKICSATYGSFLAPCRRQVRHLVQCSVHGPIRKTSRAVRELPSIGFCLKGGWQKEKLYVKPFGEAGACLE